MAKKSTRRTKRIRNLVVVFSLTAIILSVSTFAWFIGMRTVNVSSFDVEIASTDSLLLSLDGVHWSSDISISKDTIDDLSYVGNTNSWGGDGLIPMSSIGEMEGSVSRMKLFEKASLTATKGGYRLLASRVNNLGATEQDGYVAFDLFVKNFSGTQYIEGLDEKDEEAIYLTDDSSVKVAVGGVENTGIENSVRVAFAQIGRVAGTTTADQASKITGITCNNDTETPDVYGKIVDGVTGICRTAQIWEPNDTDHVQNAISWYNKSCIARVAPVEPATTNDVTDPATYSGACSTVADKTAYETYAISDVVTNADNVDIYDGTDYNTYTHSSKLVSYDYFTDTEKDLNGTARPTFMTFAPNSITKVRVYVWIEGQDIDNYDFASIGKRIAVNFGFTKERYTEEDVEYTEPELQQRPVITLAGSQTTVVAVGSTYTDAGATASDVQDGDLTSSLVVTGATDFDTATAGKYYVKYNVTDSDSNAAYEVVRTVIVK